jgi:geranyl-CoA carboxylase alpha subunit
MTVWPFDSVLVANRGEIAVRIIRTLNALGLRSIAVFSDADADAPHVRHADQAMRIGPAPVGKSYLCIDSILAAAKASGAGAIHPGYGFLSENSAFCQACIDAGLVFVGPGPEAIRVMGDKRLAKERMQAAGVPCIPGYLSAMQHATGFVAAAREVGYPVMVKAAAGGGGRGMRRVDDEAALLRALESARSEALNAFGDGTLYLERALPGARHVEVQILADRHGRTLHLGERDCSVQRRHQKIVEEAPSPAVTPELRERMTRDAICAAQAIGYQNAGTIEFLLDGDGRYYFLEMNTRLQVEHPVTECVTGLDLVEWQVRIAAGEPLALEQSQLSIRGHAIEVRLYAEDPEHGFLPQTGQVALWEPAWREGVRIDSGIATGQAVSPHYDPMLAKLVAHGRDREEARRRLAAAVEHSVLLGVPTNKDYLSRILRHPEFVSAAATTEFVARLEAQGAAAEPPALRAVAALLHCWPDRMDLRAWRDAGPGSWTVRLGTAPIRVERQADGAAIVSDGRSAQPLVPLSRDANTLTLMVGAERHVVRFVRQPRGVEIAGFGRTARFEETPPPAVREATQVRGGRLVAPMPGRIVRIHSRVGDLLSPRDCVLVVEAMKMEHEVVAGVAGCLASLAVAMGEQVQARQLLGTVTPAAAQ